MLATEEPSAPSNETGPRPTVLENWSENERMRHIPRLEWILRKLEDDLAPRIEKLWLPYSDLPASDPRHAAIEAEIRAFCRSVDRVSETARRHRGHPHPPSDLRSRITWSVQQAVASLVASDPDLFGRRFPYQTFERSNAEPLWAAMLSAIQHVQNLVTLIREIDPGIDERMYENLVQLREPLRRDPIA
jgi:hypothetical protein